VTSNRDRQRAAARARLEREMAERASSARRRRRMLTVGGAGLGVLVVVAGVVWIAVATNDDDKDTNANPGASASASAGPAGCAWKPVVDPSASPAPSAPPGIKDVGTPPASGEPRTGREIMTITTNRGPIKVEIDNEKVPCAAASFRYLAGKKFFDNTTCHRMIKEPTNILWCGDPSGTSSGGPSYNFAAENVPADRRPPYPVGSVVLLGGEGGNGSQFLILYDESPQLPSQFTLLGKVTEGLDVVKKVAADGVTPTDPSNAADGKPKSEVKIASVTFAPA
jgi:peptidyl-prolyl cis-trans isomerase B (cyclophilin B)